MPPPQLSPVLPRAEPEADADNFDIGSQLSNFKAILQMIDDTIGNPLQPSSTTEALQQLRGEAQLLLGTCSWSMESWRSSFGPWTERAASLLQVHLVTSATQATSSASAAEPCQHTSSLPRDIDRTNRLSSPSKKKHKKR